MKGGQSIDNEVHCRLKVENDQLFETIFDALTGEQIQSVFRRESNVASLWVCDSLFVSWTPILKNYSLQQSKEPPAVFSSETPQSVSCSNGFPQART